MVLCILNSIEGYSLQETSLMGAFISRLIRNTQHELFILKLLEQKNPSGSVTKEKAPNDTKASISGKMFFYSRNQLFKPSLLERLLQVNILFLSVSRYLQRVPLVSFILGLKRVDFRLSTRSRLEWKNVPILHNRL
jgi:hypothetical protein